MKKSNLVLIVFVSMIILSCGSSITRLTSVNYPKTDIASIEVFTSKKPSKDYIEIATISVLRIKSKMLPLKRSAQKVLRDMKEKASSIGGHAIINYRESGDANMTGTVIRYK